MDDDFSVPPGLVGGTWSVDLWLWQLTWSPETRAIHEVAPGITPALWEAMEFLDLQDRPRLIAAFFGCVNERAPFRHEAGLTTGTGGRKRVRITGFPLEDGRGNLTAVRGLIEEVLTPAPPVAPPVPQLTCEALQAHVKELEALALAVPHELRAPLATVHGFATILQETESPRLSPAGQRYLQRILAATLRMDRLTQALMTLAPLSPSHLRHEQVDLSAAAHEEAALLNATQPHRQVLFDIEPGLMAIGDPELLRQVLSNLMGNAWKFTGRSPAACIGVGARHQGGQTVYSVADNGVGFDMQAAGGLFSAFHRMHPDFEGTGVGLAVVRRIVERHGGSIWADSSPGRGATFFFTLWRSQAGSAD